MAMLYNGMAIFLLGMKQHFINELFEIFENLPKLVKDAVSFAGFVFLGTYYKIKKQQNKGLKKKLTVSWFTSEFILSSFIALIGWGILDHLMSLPKFLTFALCAFLGSISTTFHDKTEELVISFFDAVKVKIDKIINANGNK